MENKLKNIKLIITDIDGVWTDGGLYYSSEGLVMKKFNVKDGMGVVRLREYGIETAIISGDGSPVINARGDKLKLELVYTSQLDKISALDDICCKRSLKYENIAFIGDDSNDIDIIKKVGFSAAPADALEEVLKIADYVCKKKGGEGCFREIAEMILTSNRD
jgi:YrbI family 3-deoxy-D-manno-octulosonate 8-phosphate phosphatase